MKVTKEMVEVLLVGVSFETGVPLRLIHLKDRRTIFVGVNLDGEREVLVTLSTELSDSLAQIRQALKDEISVLEYDMEALEKMRQLIRDVPATESLYTIPAWTEWFQRRADLLGPEPDEEWFQRRADLLGAEPDEEWFQVLADLLGAELDEE